MTHFLTVEQILFLHARLIVETGGRHGVRDVGLLASATMRPQATFDGEYLYPDLFTKAAALMHSIIRNHPFMDGNKRTGIAAAGIFLRLNNHRLTATNQELETFTFHVTVSRPDISEISFWLESHSTSIP